MTYRPGDAWGICDLSGKKVLRSTMRKTWDGLLVHPDFWYPKHPQLTLRGIPERSMAVRDPRPRPADIYYTLPYALGTFCLVSPNGTYWTFAVADDGALLPYNEVWGQPQPVLDMAGHLFTVDDDGALHVRDKINVRPDAPWRIVSPSEIQFNMSVDTDHAVLLNIVGGPAYMEGVFTLISPNGTSYVVYIEDPMACVRVRTGSWGPSSTNFYLDTFEMHVDNTGSLHNRPSGEQHAETYRMVSTENREYMWHVFPDGSVRLEREGHWWDVSVLVQGKPVGTTGFQDSYYDATEQITEDGQHSWFEE